MFNRLLSYFLVFTIIFISIFSFLSDNVNAADNDFYTSNGTGGISEDEANRAISNKGDIYNSDGVLLLRYTPTDSYNWTYDFYENIHMDDLQAKAYLMASNVSAIPILWASSSSTDNSYMRYLFSIFGFLWKGNDEFINDFVYKISTDYQALNSLEYDEDTNVLVINNNNGYVDELRAELKEYYYESIGLNSYTNSAGTVKDLLNSSEFRDMFEYEEDYTFSYAKYQDYKFAFRCGSGSFYPYFLYCFIDDNDEYVYIGTSKSDGFDYNASHYYYPVYRFSADSSSFYNFNQSCSVKYYNFNSSLSYFSDIEHVRLFMLDGTDLSIGYIDESGNSVDLRNAFKFYKAYNADFTYFSSYSAAYNYIHGDSNAYLTSKIEETGKDVSIKLDEINDNFSEKLDELIDSVNNQKVSLTADELQDLIDNGFADLFENMEDIKDNTEETNSKLDSIIQELQKQNETLLDILGVTRNIANDISSGDDSSDSSYDDVSSGFSHIYESLEIALLYGVNPLDPDFDSASYAAMSSDISTFDSGGGTFDDNHSGSGGGDYYPSNGLMGKFPFSLFYQSYNWLKILNTPSEVPSFSFNYGFMIGQKDNPDYVISFDLSAYQSWADNCKSFLRLSFTLLFSVFVIKRIRRNI